MVQRTFSVALDLVVSGRCFKHKAQSLSSQARKESVLEPEIETQLYLAAPPPGRIDALPAVLEAADVASVCAFDGLSYGEELATLRDICHTHDLPLVVEAGSGKAVDLATEYGLDGVHVPATAKTIAHARRALGKDAIVGADAGTSRHNAMNAAEAGADYVTFGPATGDAPVDRGLIDWWALVIETPQVVGGGLTPESAGGLVGVTDFILLRDEIWTAADPVTALRAFGALLPRT